MRYEESWVFQCMGLRMKAPCAYQHLKENRILPLPDKSTIRRLLSYMPCKFGFNSFALESIGRRFKNLPKHLRYGSLVWDEMAIAKDVNLNVETLTVDGYVDLGGEVNMEGKQQELELADHALVFLFRPYRSNWIQPIAVFATKGSASGQVLQQLVLKAITALEKQGAIVKNVVCDGCQTNKNLASRLGISGKKEKLKYWIEHPTDDDSNIYFLFDVPHLFKCIRNIFLHKDVQVNEAYILLNFVKAT